MSRHSNTDGVEAPLAGTFGHQYVRTRNSKFHGPFYIAVKPATLSGSLKRQRRPHEIVASTALRF